MKKTNRELLFKLATNSLADAISAGYDIADARRAGYSLADAISAGYSLADAISAGYDIEEWKQIPVLDKPYTKLLADLKAKKRVHDQSTFGPESEVPEENVCGTAMCTAGHIINMAGAFGYALKNKYGWGPAATLICKKTYPDQPVQNFGSIPQSWAMAYIETMAEREASGEAKHFDVLAELPTDKQ